MHDTTGIGPARKAAHPRRHPLARLAAVAGLVLAGIACPAQQPAMAGDAATLNHAAGPGASLPIRAQLTPRHAAVLSTEIAGKISALPVREGESFNEGDEIAAIDCDTYMARLDLATAKATGAARKLEAVRLLDQRKAVGRVDLDLAVVELDSANAEKQMAAKDVSRCSIRAPYSGRVAELRVKRFQSVSAAEPVIEVLNERDLEVELLIPSRWVGWAQPGGGFTVTIEELQRDYPAQITRIVPRIDPVSQTVKIFGRITGDHPELLAGMSGVVRLIKPADSGNGPGNRP